MYIKRIIKICLITGLICLITVLCCLPFVNFKDNKTVIHADLSPCGVDVGTDTVYPYEDYLYIGTLDFNLSLLSSPDAWSTNVSRVFPMRMYLYKSRILFYFGNYNDGRFDYGSYLNATTLGSWQYYYADPFGIGEYVRMQYYIDTNFDFGSISLCYLVRENEWDGNAWFNYHIEVLDTNNNKYRLKFFYYAQDPAVFNWGDYYDRPIYFVLGGSVVSNNVYYQQGYSDGLADGSSSNQQNIYNDGYNHGLDIGKALGRQEALEENDYTLLGFIGAIVDVPLQAFTGLLSFDILGFNVLRLVTGCLTIGLVFIFIRFVFFRGK